MQQKNNNALADAARAADAAYRAALHAAADAYRDAALADAYRDAALAAARDALAAYRAAAYALAAK